MSEKDYVGSPAIFRLGLACQQVNEAFPESFGCFLVGSAIERPDWRDVDVRMILPDDAFAALFPRVAKVGDWGVASWEFDPRWILLANGTSQFLGTASGLPVDFQFQPQTYANRRHDKTRHPLGVTMTAPDPE